jgi:uncharacterized protein (TIGR02145 family)
MKLYNISFKSVCLVIISLCFQSALAQQFDTITDNRDGQKYTIVKIGRQWWMAQNLNYYTSAGSAYYNYDSVTYSKTLGRLYSWVMASQSCPSGWHLSTNNDWKRLENYLGIPPDVYEAIEKPHVDHPFIGTNQGDKLKKDTSFWMNTTKDTSNSTGFSALPGGLRFGNDAPDKYKNKFGDLGCGAQFWADEYSTSSAYVRILSNTKSQIHVIDGDKSAYRSVRCVKNEQESIHEISPYMGQEPPGLLPKIFTPAWINPQFDICFTKDGQECYYTVFADGYGGWTAPRNLGPTINTGQALGKNGYGCAIGDLNNDGYPDIYITHADLGPDQVWFNDGKGVFVNSGQNIGNTVKRDRSIALADLNGDGYLDVFIANDQIGNDIGCPNEVWLNDGTGKLTDSGQCLGNLASSDIALSDMDGDGDIDAVIANLHDLQNTYSQSNEIWLNDGKGNFTRYSIDLGSRSYNLILADINNDNKKDIIFDCTIWINKGNAEFVKSTETFGNGRRLYFGDFDKDGDQDAFVLKGGPSGDMPNEIWINDGTGTFTDSGQKLGNSCGYTATIGDIDGDNDQDIYVANGFANIIEADIIWINQGGMQGGKYGTFAESKVVFPATRSWEVRLADFNNDKKMDILVTNGWGRDEENKVYLQY